MIEASIPPDERVFRAHLEAGRFQSGLDLGRWRVLSVTWPHAVIAVTAAWRQDGPSEFSFRFELTDYPRTLPTAQPWDSEGSLPLSIDKWPAGDTHVSRAFNPGWNSTALYLPFDRLALAGHEGWLTVAPADRWDPSIGITQYLRRIYELINSINYHGIRRPAA